MLDDLIEMAESTLQQDLAESAQIKARIALRDRLAQHLMSTQLLMPSGDLAAKKFASSIASSFVAQIEIDIDERFFKDDKHQKFLDLFAKLITRIYEVHAANGFSRRDFKAIIARTCSLKYP